jgi:hypothetical protein
VPCAPVRRQGLCVPDRGPTSLVLNPVLKRNLAAVAHPVVLGVVVARRLIQLLFVEARGLIHIFLIVEARRLVQVTFVEARRLIHIFLIVEARRLVQVTGVHARACALVA